mmetsp:Transcript_5624/g.16739  ORF Transcript_5624/g.16739 Transcript_5624/m.16739 type:complete len:205 (+) Transcript_5624:200-814(+)
MTARRSTAPSGQGPAASATVLPPKTSRHWPARPCEFFHSKASSASELDGGSCAGAATREVAALKTSAKPVPGEASTAGACLPASWTKCAQASTRARSPAGTSSAAAAAAAGAPASAAPSTVRISASVVICSLASSRPPCSTSAHARAEIPPRSSAARGTAAPPSRPARCMKAVAALSSGARDSRRLLKRPAKSCANGCNESTGV